MADTTNAKILVVSKNVEDRRYMEEVMRKLPYKNVEYVVGALPSDGKVYDFAIFDAHSLPPVSNAQAQTGLSDADQAYLGLYGDYLSKSGIEYILYFGKYFHGVDLERSPAANTVITLASRVREVVDFVQAAQPTRNILAESRQLVLSKSQSARFDLRLNRVELTNFRLFRAGEERLQLDFHENLTVLIGENGAGKTSLLDATFNLLTVLAQKIRNQTISMKHLENPADVRNGTLDATIEASVSILATLPNSQDGDPSEEVEEHSLEWFATLNPDDGYDVDEKSDSDTFRRLDEAVHRHGRWLKENFFAQETPKDINLPLLAYYPCRRSEDWLSDASSHGNGSKYTTQTIFNGYDGILDGNAFSFRDFFEWFSWRENIAKQLGQDIPHRLVLQALYDMLNEEGEKTFQNLRMDYLNVRGGEMLIDIHGEPKNVNQLSSGQKSLIALVSDLARRLCVLNPHKPNPLQGNGIVLIDEIDLHLHPRWQRRVIPQLRKTFPNVQFVVTTHSPLVLQQIHSDQIRVLDEGNVYSAEATLGRPVSSILNVVMETPDNLYRNEIKEIFKEIALDNLEKAQMLIDKVKANTEGSLPDLDQAEATIQRKKLLAQ